jgi:hypothetical protein
MGWTIEKSAKNFNSHLGVAAQATWDRFQNAVHQGMHPKIAAQQAGDTDYKLLGTAKIGQFQIRLSHGDRATFTVDESTQVVKVLQVGGHT